MHGAKANVVVNWGLAAVVYAIAGALILRALPRPAILGRLRRPWRRRRRLPFA
jgi:hypothetical protein